MLWLINVQSIHMNDDMSPPPCVATFLPENSMSEVSGVQFVTSKALLWIPHNVLWGKTNCWGSKFAVLSNQD